MICSELQGECVKVQKRNKAVIITDDHKAVAALPDDWVPKHSGPTLANYLKQRRKDHEKILKDLSKNSATVSEVINDKVRVLAEDLLTHIKLNQRDMDCIIEKYNTVEVVFTKGARYAALKEIDNLHVQRVEYVVAFKRDARALEQQREDELRALLREQFQRLVALGHETPKDILHDFDQRIYEINQQLLGNSRAYTELEAQLKVQADESVTRARTSLNQLGLGVGMIPRGRSAIPWTKEVKNLFPRSTSADGNHDPSTLSLGGILSNVEELDLAVSHLVQAYRTAVSKFFSGFSDMITELRKHLSTQKGPSDGFQVLVSIDFQKIIEWTVNSLSSNINKKNQSKYVFAMTGADILTAQKSLWSLGECLRDTFNILHDAGHLWDTHILRSALAQKLTIAAVEDLLTSNDAIEQAHEVPFSISLEKMRCSPDANVVQNEFIAIKAMHDCTAELYLQHSQAELGRLEEFLKLPTLMANILLAEFKVFLEKHPRSKGKGTSEPSSPMNTYNSVNLPLPRAILQTELQEVALNNWQNGFLESFESNVSLIPEELKRQAQLWVDERGAALQMRFSMKMMSHSVRLERLIAARDARLAELKFHEVRLHSHLQAVYGLVERLPAEAAQFAAIDAPFLYPLCKFKTLIETNTAALSQDSVNNEQKRFKLSSYITRLDKYRSLFEDSLDSAIIVCKKQMEYRVQEARVSNIRFISQIKMFSEGGRYSAAEALKTCASLLRGSEALESSMERAATALTRRRGQLLGSADTYLAPLRQLLGVETVRKHAEPTNKKQTKKR